MEYSAKQAIWDVLPEEDTILMHYPSHVTQGSFGINLTNSSAGGNNE